MDDANHSEPMTGGAGIWKWAQRFGSLAGVITVVSFLVGVIDPRLAVPQLERLQCSVREIAQDQLGLAVAPQDRQNINVLVAQLYGGVQPDNTASLAFALEQSGIIGIRIFRSCRNLGPTPGSPEGRLSQMARAAGIARARNMDLVIWGEVLDSNRYVLQFATRDQRGLYAYDRSLFDVGDGAALEPENLARFVGIVNSSLVSRLAASYADLTRINSILDDFRSRIEATTGEPQRSQTVDTYLFTLGIIAGPHGGAYLPMYAEALNVYQGQLPAILLYQNLLYYFRSVYNYQNDSEAVMTIGTSTYTYRTAYEAYESEFATLEEPPMQYISPYLWQANHHTTVANTLIHFGHINEEIASFEEAIEHLLERQRLEERNGDLFNLFETNQNINWVYYLIADTNGWDQTHTVQYFSNYDELTNDQRFLEINPGAYVATMQNRIDANFHFMDSRGGVGYSEDIEIENINLISDARRVIDITEYDSLSRSSAISRLNLSEARILLAAVMRDYDYSNAMMAVDLLNSYRNSAEFSVLGDSEKRDTLANLVYLYSAIYQDRRNPADRQLAMELGDDFFSTDWLGRDPNASHYFGRLNDGYRRIDYTDGSAEALRALLNFGERELYPRGIWTDVDLLKTIEAVYDLDGVPGDAERGIELASAMISRGTQNDVLQAYLMRGSIYYQIARKTDDSGAARRAIEDSDRVLELLVGSSQPSDNEAFIQLRDFTIVVRVLSLAAWSRAYLGVINQDPESVYEAFPYYDSLVIFLESVGRTEMAASFRAERDDWIH
jgi:hypothetical protein